MESFFIFLILFLITLKSKTVNLPDFTVPVIVLMALRIVVGISLNASRFYLAPGLEKYNAEISILFALFVINSFYSQHFTSISILVSNIVIAIYFIYLISIYRQDTFPVLQSGYLFFSLVVTASAFLLHYYNHLNLIFVALRETQDNSRIFGTMGNPNHLGAVISYSILMLWHRKPKPIGHLSTSTVRIFRFWLLLFFITGLLFTASLSAIFSLAFTFLVLYVLRGSYLKIVYSVAIVFLFIVTVLLITAHHDFIIEAIKSTYIYQRIHTEDLWQASGRLEFINRLINAYAGSDTLTQLLGLGASYASERGYAPHNTYIRLLTLHGLLFFVVFSVLVVHLMYTLNRSSYIKKNKEIWMQLNGIVWFTLLLGLAADEIFMLMSGGLLFWFAIFYIGYLSKYVKSMSFQYGTYIREYRN